MHRRPLLLLALAAGLVAGGCGGNPSVGRVRGQVTWQGKPVSQGRITFYPEAGRAATGVIQSDGTYTVTTFTSDDGALLGRHRVAVHATRVGGGTLVAPRNADEEAALARTPGGKVLVPGAVEWLVPEKYSAPDTSGLTADVQRGDNQIDFHLPSK